MSGPAAGETGRSHAAARLGSRDALGALALLLAVGLTFRLIIAYILAPGSGFDVDITDFTFWARELGANGPFGFYDRGFYSDYTPGYLYVLWLIGLIGAATGNLADLIKLPAILGDAILAVVVYRMAIEAGGPRRGAMIAATFVVLNPVTWFVSSVWGQVDSIGTIVLLLALQQLWRGHSEKAAALATLAAIIKPQFGILLPIGAVVLARRHLYGPSELARLEMEDWELAHPGRAGGLLGPFHAWGRREQGAIRLASSAGVALLTAVLTCLPFGMSIVDLAIKVVGTAGGYPYLTVNAYNPWALATKEGSGIVASGTWINDWVFSIGPVPAVLVGTALLLLLIGALCWFVVRRDDRRSILLALTVLSIGFFVLPTRVHERYLFPFFALGAILASTSLRWWVAYGLLAVTNVLNLYAILTLPFYANPGVHDWLGMGDSIRSGGSVTLIALTTLGAFLWALIEFVRRGRASDDDLLVELVPEAEAEPGFAFGWGSVRAGPPRMAGGYLAPGAAGEWEAGRGARPWGEPAPGGRDLVGGGPIGSPGGMGRGDRLAGETGGRLDRLDLWLLVVLCFAVLTLRTFRLGEPRQFYFDEVYHARTAMEFLQDWRYEQPHSIYEFTHPHLAKYLIALGIVAAGDNRIVAESELGAPVTEVAIESRWNDPALPEWRAGDRLYVATGSGIRVFDLLDRSLLTTIAIGGARSVAVDEAAHRLFVGSSDGTILTLETRELDRLRTGGLASEIGPLELLGTVRGGLERIFVPEGGSTLLAIAGEDELVAIDSGSGEELGRRVLAGIADLSSAGSGSALVAVPEDVTDPVGEAEILAAILGGSEERYLAALESERSQVTVAVVPEGPVRDELDRAIAEDRLAGLSVESVPRVAVADATGIVFVAATLLEILDEIPLEAPATGLATTSGLDAPYLYGATGDQVVAIRIDRSDAAPVVDATIKLPGRAERLQFNKATELVHVLGRTPDGERTTIYVIEPHGNSVFADAPLEFEPVAWAMDVQRGYPSRDREQLLVFGGGGQAAAISVGQNAFAWRLPGVLAGTAMAACFYLLGRILFRRRSIAVLMALFSLVDGMLFVQSRIAMNDVFVGLFLVAAYTLFAALWTGWFRWRGAFWAVLPLIGLLLGLGLATKWVTVYAIGGIVLLILARSALGRLLLIGGLAVATAVLGYMAIAVPAEAKWGANWLFFGVMVGATIAATVATVLRPVAWTRSEFWFAIAVPAVLGFVALAGGLTQAPSTPLAGAGAVALGASFLAALSFWLAGQFGAGPLATDSGSGASPAPSGGAGWLVLGRGLGLPAVWMVVMLVGLPLVVYVVSYVPWAALGNQLVGPCPPGQPCQTLLDLTRSMYDYHNGLRATHPAASPWWSWPLNLKPVWFYADSFGGGTGGSIYDSGNLALWWLGIPAMAFCAWQAWRRRSLALGLIVVAFLAQWLPWSRIDRATFQYHYYTALPFVLLALAYLLAEVWHGPSARTWLLARVSAALAVLAPAILWLGRGTLCSIVRVEEVNPGSQACVNTAGQFTLTAEVAGVVGVLLLGLIAILWQLIALERGVRSGAGERRALVGMGITVLVSAVALVLAGTLLGSEPVLEIKRLPAEAAALAVGVPLLVVAGLIMTARNRRRFVFGTVLAAVLLFVVFYPNLSGLPLPAAFVNVYQGVLPTWLYPFQFAVNTDQVRPTDWFAPTVLGLPALPTLVLALLITALVIAAVTWLWRSTPSAARPTDWAEPIGRSPGPV